MSSHVFLFRHCVRSTKDTVSFHNDEKYGAFSTNPYDYLGGSNGTASSPYNWGVPELWCTPKGLEIMRGTGRWLGRQMLSATNKLRITIVSDVSERDVQTAWALSMGMADVLGSVDGIADVILDPTLFNPTQANNYTKTALCNEVNATLKNEQIKERFNTTLNLAPVVNDTVAMLNKYVTLDWNASDIDLVMGDDGEFQGLPNLLKLLAQNAFYSRASNLDPAFIPSMTVDDMYELLTWVYYTRYVRDVGNAAAALQGGVMAEMAFRFLEKGNLASPIDDTETLTLIIGHDGDLDRLSTAFGMEWKPPVTDTYRYPDLQMTPPGSGVHMEVSPIGQLQVEYVYPELVLPPGSLNDQVTGDLEVAPIEWLSVSGNATSSNEAPDTLDDLKSRVASILASYPQASDCFSLAMDRPIPGAQPVPPPPPPESPTASPVVAPTPSPTGSPTAFPTRTLVGPPFLQEAEREIYVTPPGVQAAIGILSALVAILFCCLVVTWRMTCCKSGAGGARPQYARGGNFTNDKDFEMI